MYNKQPSELRYRIKTCTKRDRVKLPLGHRGYCQGLQDILHPNIHTKPHPGDLTASPVEQQQQINYNRQ